MKNSAVRVKKLVDALNEDVLHGYAALAILESLATEMLASNITELGEFWKITQRACMFAQAITNANALTERHHNRFQGRTAIVTLSTNL